MARNAADVVEKGGTLHTRLTRSQQGHTVCSSLEYNVAADKTRQTDRRDVLFDQLTHSPLLYSHLVFTVSITPHVFIFYKTNVVY